MTVKATQPITKELSLSNSKHNDEVAGTIPCVGASGLIIQQCVIAKIFHLPMPK